MGGQEEEEEEEGGGGWGRSLAGSPRRGSSNFKAALQLKAFNESLT